MSTYEVYCGFNFFMAKYKCQKQNVNLHLWIPDIFEFKGGIQVYSAFLIAALQSLYPDFYYDVFLKHDKNSSKAPPSLPNTNFHFAGNWHMFLRTLVFASQLLGLGLWKRPQLVLASHINFIPVAYVLKLLTGIPYWVVGHGTDVWNIENHSLRNALRCADRILAVSEYTRDRLLKEQNLDPDKISLLPNTFDADRFQIAPKPQRLLSLYGLNAQQPIILTVARLDSSQGYKGYDQIIRALPEIRHHIPNIHYAIVGKGNDLSRIEHLIAQLDLQGCVTLTGFVPDEELCDYYNLCDVFAMPSKGEGFGIVYLEALACGKTVLAGNQDGSVDALCHGELGALIDPDDLEVLAQTLIQILQGTYPNPMIYQPENLRQKIIDAFGFERFKQTLGQLIEKNLIGADL
jgi:glycosyltransferase involved in cell wall biosynthesis